MSSLTLILTKVGIQNIYCCKIEWKKKIKFVKWWKVKKEWHFKGLSIIMSSIYIFQFELNK